MAAALSTSFQYLLWERGGECWIQHLWTSLANPYTSSLGHRHQRSGYRPQVSGDSHSTRWIPNVGLWHYTHSVWVQKWTLTHFCTPKPGTIPNRGVLRAERRGGVRFNKWIMRVYLISELLSLFFFFECNNESMPRTVKNAFPPILYGFWFKTIFNKHLIRFTTDRC